MKDAIKKWGARSFWHGLVVAVLFGAVQYMAGCQAIPGSVPTTSIPAKTTTTTTETVEPVIPERPLEIRP